MTINSIVSKYSKPGPKSQLNLRWDFTKTPEPVLPEVQGESECRLEAEQTVKQEARIRTKLLAILYLI